MITLNTTSDDCVSDADVFKRKIDRDRPSSRNTLLYSLTNDHFPTASGVFVQRMRPGSRLNPIKSKED